MRKPVDPEAGADGLAFDQRPPWVRRWRPEAAAPMSLATAMASVLSMSAASTTRGEQSTQAARVECLADVGEDVDEGEDPEAGVGDEAPCLPAPPCVAASVCRDDDSLPPIAAWTGAGVPWSRRVARDPLLVLLPHLRAASRGAIGLPRAERGEYQGSEVFTASHARLHSLPNLPSVHLKKLCVSFNQLETLPVQLGLQTRLVHLDVFHNQLRVFPVVILQLRKLQRLQLSSNMIAEVPEDISLLSELVDLSLSHNNLQSFPRRLLELPQLRRLDLASNQFVTLSSDIPMQCGLQFLDVSNNQLVSIPWEIGRLSALRTLHLTGNRLRKLPASLGHIKCLSVLAAASNLLVALPSTLIPRLDETNIIASSNPLADGDNAPPPPILLRPEPDSLLTLAMVSVINYSFQLRPGDIPHDLMQRVQHARVTWCDCCGVCFAPVASPHIEWRSTPASSVHEHLPFATVVRPACAYAKTRGGVYRRLGAGGNQVHRNRLQDMYSLASAYWPVSSSASALPL